MKKRHKAGLLLTLAVICMAGFAACGPHTHSLTLHPAEEATCTEAGNTAYWSCSCGKYFSDGEGKTEIAGDSWIIPAAGHDFEDGACRICGYPQAGTEGLAYTLIEGGMAYEVSGIGEATDQKIVIPSAYRGLPVIGIGEYAFENCDITSLYLPDSIRSIGWKAFQGCSRLTGVFITDLAAWCEAEVAFDSNPLFHAENLYLNNKPVRELVVPKGVTQIGDNVFSSCKNLTSVTVPDSVTRIGARAFSECENLMRVSIPDSVTSVGVDAFYNTGYYNEEANWEDNLRYIGKHLVATRYGQESCKLKPDTRTIAAMAFRYETTLKNIVIPDSVVTIGNGAFYFCRNLEKVTIGRGVTSIEADAFMSCESLTNIAVAEGNPNYRSVDGDLYSKDGRTLLQYANGKKEALFVIPDGVTGIGDAAFAFCDTLTRVVIPDSVTRIGDLAFSWCMSLTSVTIGKGVTSIGHEAFSPCNSLTSAVFAEPDGWRRVGSEEGPGGAIPSDDLADPETAADCLTSLHSDYDWEREPSA